MVSLNLFLGDRGEKGEKGDAIVGPAGNKA